MRFHVLTIFPDMIKNVMNESIMGRAQENKLFELNVLNIRDFTDDKHLKTDDYIYGGGCGMLMTPQPIYSAYEHVLESIKEKSENNANLKKPRIILTSPKGRRYNQEFVKELADEDDIIIICGHYEGVDQRIIDLIVTDEVSTGDYVLTGGELPACIIMDSVARLLPGVLNKEESFEDETFENNTLEYPQYTRPAEFKGLKVPDVLLSGNHAEIKKWREEMSLKLTKEGRPDLLKQDYVN